MAFFYNLHSRAKRRDRFPSHANRSRFAFSGIACTSRFAFHDNTGTCHAAFPVGRGCNLFAQIVRQPPGKCFAAFLAARMHVSSAPLRSLDRCFLWRYPGGGNSGLKTWSRAA